MNAITESGIKLALNDNAEIYRGGEGRILLLPDLPDRVAKIYLDEQHTLTQAQLQALSVLDEHVFVKPIELIYKNAGGRALGFTMPLLPASFVPLQALFSEPYCRKQGICNTRKMNIATKVREAVLLAHQHNIVIGDLSALNIVVNNADEVKFIDVDSYGTSAQAHSGVLLDEIRDYYYNGMVSKESDYFALAILLFQLFTHAHPFKGIHPRFSALKDRMIQQLPLFAPDKQLIVPKCYRPISNTDLQNQFNTLFMQGLRVPISLLPDTTMQQPVQHNPQLPFVLRKKDLVGKIIFQPQSGEVIEAIQCLPQRLLLTTNRTYLIYELNYKGIARLTHSFKRNIVDDRVLIGEQQIIAVNKGALYTVMENGNLQPLHNTSLEQGYRFAQFGNILVVVENNLLKIIDLDVVNNGFIQTEQTKIFGQGFRVHNGSIWQNAGGSSYIFYRSGKTISTVKSTFIIRDLMVRGDKGIICHQTQKTVGETALQYAYFGIENLQMQIETGSGDLGLLKHVAYKPHNKQHGYIFEPVDNYLYVRRTEDGAIMHKAEYPDMAEQDELYITNAGLVRYSVSGQLELLNLN